MKSLLLLAAALLVSLPAAGQSGFWHREAIAGGAGADRGSDLVVDAAGRTHVVFVRDNGTGGTGLYHAVKDGPNEPWSGSWIVGAAGTGRREQVSLAVDANGRLHASYVLRGSPATGQLFHATRGFGEAGWTFTQVSSSASVGGLAGTSIDVTGTGLAGIAYTGLASGELRFASQQSGGGGWTDAVASAAAGSGFAPSLDLLGAGIGDRVLISHYDAAGDDLKLTRFVAALSIPPSAPTWVTETVMASGQAGSASAVRRLPDGSIGVAYFQIDGTAMVRFGRKSGAAWTHETIDSSAGESGDSPLVGHRLAMELDALGAPMVTYAKGQFALLAIVTEEVRHARRLVAGRWGIEPVRTGLAANDELAIAAAVNGAGTPQVVLFTGFSEGPPALEWLRPMAGGWVAEDLNPLLPNTGSGHPFGATAVTHRGDEEFVLIHTSENLSFSNLRLLRRSGSGPRQLVGGFQLARCDQLALARPRAGDTILFAARRNANSLDAWAISATDGSLLRFSNPIGNVDEGEFDLALGPDGRLHLLCTRGGALSYYRSSSPETPSPSLLFDLVPLPGNPAGDGASVAVSRQGAVALAYRDTSSGQLRLIVVPPGGDPALPATVDIPTAGTTGQATTDVAFDGEIPYLAWATIDAQGRSAVRVKTATGLLLDEHFPNTRVGTVKCAVAHGRITTTWLAVARASEKVPAHLGYGVCRADGAREARLTAAAVVADSFWNANGSLADGFSLDVDARGEPKISLILRDITPPDNGDYLLLLQPADALDADGDGLILLEENAFVRNPLQPDPGPPVVADFPVQLNGELRHRFTFNHSGLATPVRTGSAIRIGEFGFLLTHGPDLQSFTPDLGPSGSGPLSISAGIDWVLELSTTPPVSRSNPYLGYRFFLNYHPRQFSRLEYRRLGIEP